MTDTKEVPAYSFSPLDPEYAQEMATWRYPPPYDIYDGDDSPAGLAYLLDPANQIHVVRDSRGNPVGYCSFGRDAQVPGGQYGPGYLDLGIGLHPDWTGRGLGAGVIQAMMAFGRRQFGARAFRATIATFNLRSQAAFRRAGFRPGPRFQQPTGGESFQIFTWEPGSD